LQIEFPIDHPVYRPNFRTAGFRVSRSGEWVASSECRASTGPCAIAIVNRSGQKRILADDLDENIGGIAWSADDREVWFAVPKTGAMREVLAVDLRGRLRNILRLPTDLYLQDVASNGDVLIEMVSSRRETVVSRAGARSRPLVAGRHGGRRHDVDASKIL
jgi:hypothetical protein